MSISLYSYQREAVYNLKDGCILCGGVGTGKSRTSLAYYYKEMGGNLDSDDLNTMRNPLDLYIITTARKRDTKEWEHELIPFGMYTNLEREKLGNPFGYTNNIVIDSWNNIHKYKDVTNAFFIFDEQRVIGSGKWVQSFLKISKSNRWILLSATPGDTWADYIPVFIANGFYKNRTEFAREHIVYSRFTNYPKIDRYINTGRLIRLRNKILVDMKMERKTIFHSITVPCDYDVTKYKFIGKNRWDIYEDSPIETASELCYIWRKLVNSSEDRQKKFKKLVEDNQTAIVFYNFNYELDILKNILDEMNIEYSQWNGHKHQEIPRGKRWVYLVQYTAGCEGWNCITTNVIIFYSQNYSYKVMEQASGRINRLNTPFTNLYSYQLRSSAPIDLAIYKALKEKKNFSENRFLSKNS